jgi:hypothetical protein
MATDNATAIREKKQGQIRGRLVISSYKICEVECFQKPSNVCASQSANPFARSRNQKIFRLERILP